jgi:hypothetical protein
MDRDAERETRFRLSFREFHFPIPNLPPQYHYAGPLHDNEGREPVSFDEAELPASDRAEES